MLYVVSIEPMYSQSVGNYEYLCDSKEKVNNFRARLRVCAENSQQQGRAHDEESWRFYESVYVLEDDADPSKPCFARLVWKEEYEGFYWLDYEMLEINYDANLGIVEMEDLPKIDHVNDFVEVEHNIPFDKFVQLVNF